MTNLQKKQQNANNTSYESNFTFPFSSTNLFSSSSFIFWLGFTIICGLLVYIFISKSDLIDKLIYKGIVVLLIIIMFLWVNLRINIKQNIMVFKTTKQNDEIDKQIIFKLDEKNKQLNFITEDYDDSKDFNKETIKNVFNNRFLQPLDNFEHNIQGPFIYNNTAHVYYINITITKPLLSGIERWKQNYRPIPIEDLIDYNKNKTNRRLNYKYNNNILPILFELNKNALE